MSEDEFEFKSYQMDSCEWIQTNTIAIWKMNMFLFSSFIAIVVFVITMYYCCIQQQCLSSQQQWKIVDILAFAVLLRLSYLSDCARRRFVCPSVRPAIHSHFHFSSMCNFFFFPPKLRIQTSPRAVGFFSRLQACSCMSEHVSNRLLLSKCLFCSSYEKAYRAYTKLFWAATIFLRLHAPRFLAKGTQRNFNSCSHTHEMLSHSDISWRHCLLLQGNVCTRLVQKKETKYRTSYTEYGWQYAVRSCTLRGFAIAFNSHLHLPLDKSLPSTAICLFSAISS